MNQQELMLILQEGEGYKIEFKEKLANIDKEIVAFANSSGGTTRLKFKLRSTSVKSVKGSMKIEKGSITNKDYQGSFSVLGNTVSSNLNDLV